MTVMISTHDVDQRWHTRMNNRRTTAMLLPTYSLACLTHVETAHFHLKELTPLPSCVAHSPPLLLPVVNFPPLVGVSPLILMCTLTTYS